MKNTVIFLVGIFVGLLLGGTVSAKVEDAWTTYHVRQVVDLLEKIERNTR